MPSDDAIMATVLRQMMRMEAISSVALSHPDDCRCDVCRASLGDGAALARVSAAMDDMGIT